MTDHISRQAAVDALKKTIAVNKNPNHDAMVWEEGMNCALSIIGAQPSVEAAPVVHGRWVKENVVLTSNPPQYQWHCSECGRLTHWFTDEVLTNYCPTCGAKMDGGEDAGRND